MQCAQWNASRAAAWRRRRRRASRANRFRANVRALPHFEKETEIRPSARTECLELVNSPNWRRCFSVKDALTRAESRRFPHSP